MATVLQTQGHSSTHPTQIHRKRANTVTAGPAPALYDGMGYLQQSKNTTQSRPREATVSAGSALLSPPESTKSSPRTESLPNAPSPAPSSSGSSTSGKSVRWGENDNSDQRCILPGHYSTQSPKSPHKPVLKQRELKAANMPSLFAENTPTIAASAAMDSVLCELVTCVKEFKCPPELDFSVNTGSPLILANVEKNKAFINQLRKLDGLRTRLAGIPTHGDALLMDKHKAAGAAIGRTLQRMKERQLKLHENFTKGVESALDAIATDLKAAVDNYNLPSELDFATNPEYQQVFLNTEWNMPFIDQPHRLDWFREALVTILAHDNEQLRNKCRVVGTGVKRASRKMEEHQLKLYRRLHTRTY
ncbi:hypothetical protein B0J17DRAFT_203012 [Rhizoctonia solani]|nr:hypothetical protein B0J17DRAFT_203012 [Rhizoctonia solani]